MSASYFFLNCQTNFSSAGKIGVFVVTGGNNNINTSVADSWVLRKI